MPLFLKKDIPFFNDRNSEIKKGGGYNLGKGARKFQHSVIKLDILKHAYFREISISASNIFLRGGGVVSRWYILIALLPTRKGMATTPLRIVKFN